MKNVSIALRFIVMCLFLVSCTKNSLSERDERRSQLANAADIKRKELMLVAGNYQGLLTQSSGPNQSVYLKLEIKDIPTPVEGQVDPVMTPILTGYLRFNFATGGDASEYIGFAIQKAEFDPNREKLDLVLNHSDYKDLIISLERKDPALKGTWTAPAIAASGNVELHRSDDTGTGSAIEQLRGEYGGTFYREDNLYQFGHLTVQTSFQPPEGLKVSATVRLIFGNWDSSEYLTYRFDPVSFNPVSGQIVFKSPNLDVSFTGSWSQGEMVGEWFSSYTGKMGKFHLKKNLTPAPNSTGSLFEALRGTYQGEVKNTNPQSNLPERALISFVTSQDLSQPSGIKITGNLRFYLGDFGSTEYVELPFTDIQYNFFTRKIVAKTAGDYKLTLKGDVKPKKISGILYSDALGEMADVEVQKQ